MVTQQNRKNVPPSALQREENALFNLDEAGSQIVSKIIDVLSSNVFIGDKSLSVFNLMYIKFYIIIM